MAAPDALTPLVEDEDVPKDQQEGKETEVIDENKAETDLEWGFSVAELYPIALTFFKGTVRMKARLQSMTLLHSYRDMQYITS